jgi:hypothetical protein
MQRRKAIKYIIIALSGISAIGLIIYFFILNGKGIFKPVVPFESGNKPAAETLYADLDGDGKDEKILYTRGGTLYINDVKFTCPKEKLGMSRPLYDYFTLMDIDSEDPYIEIGISTEGRSDDLSTLFYYYNRGDLIYMGEVSGIPYWEYEAISLEENGVLKTPRGFGILQSWSGQGFYDLTEDRQLVRREQEFYETPYDNQVNLLQPLKLYAEPDKTSESYMLPVQPVTFTMTDDKHWCKLRAEDGTEGWFYTMDFSHMEDGVTLTTKVFDGLAFYD